MVDLPSGKRAQRMALLGYILGLTGALLLGLFFFSVGFASGWGRDSIGAGIVIGILAPSVFLGASFFAALLSAIAVLPNNKSLVVGMFVFAAVTVTLLLFLYFGYFIPFVREVTGSSSAWQGHPLPVWWKSTWNWVGILSLIFILSSIGISITGMMMRRQEGITKTAPSNRSRFSS